jgi:hypothetical protein
MEGQMTVDECIALAEADTFSALIAAGDEMQSALSRIVEWAAHPLPGARKQYEVAMAVLEGESAVQAWTEARKQVRRG